jgi:hypothetical protein
VSGVTARSGFRFQDLVLAERVLAYILERRAAKIAGREFASLHFGVEAVPSSQVGTPEWDILQREGLRLTLEEAKSGEISADDRWQLWRRIRKTVASLTPPEDAESLSITLTVNAEALPSNPERWRMLAVQTQTAAGTWFTPIGNKGGSTGRKRSVESVEDLANEALHVLTKDDADSKSSPMSLERARLLLSNFKFNERHSAASIEQAVHGHINALTRDVRVEEFLSLIRGEISKRAESSEPSRHWFSGDDLLLSIAMLGRLAAVEPATLDRWRALREIAKLHLDPHESASALAYQDWKSLQQAALHALQAPGSNAVALLGRGGMGKSVLMRRWVSERIDEGDEALLLTINDVATFDPDQVLTALNLGAFAARHYAQRMVIGVDGLENVSDERRIGLLATLRTLAVSGASVCVTSRSLEWKSTRGIPENGWIVVELHEWPEDRVRELLEAQGLRWLGSDLLRLLRTPLLLDLFMRTFRGDAEIPSGLQTRHGLLDAYWKRRILPPDDERSVERRSVLLAIADDEARGICEHNVAGNIAARDLTSEGLLSLSRGVRSFRHALLRDYSMMVWARDQATSTGVIVSKLEGIRPTLVQFGALRAILEAAAAETSEAMSILAALQPPMLYHAGTALGEFEDPMSFSLVEVVDRVQADLRGDFVLALLVAIKLDRNEAWAPVFAGLPDDAVWANRTNWVTAESFLCLVETIEVLSDRLQDDLRLKVELASRLRSWSLAPRLYDGLSQKNGYALGRLSNVLSKLDPSLDTISWLTKVAGAGSLTRFWVLSVLPRIVRSLPARGTPQEDDALRLIYRSAAGLREDAGRLRKDECERRDPAVDQHLIEGVLIGESASPGLIQSRPSAFVPIAADLIAGYEADDADERQEHLREIYVRTGLGNWTSAPQVAEGELERFESEAQVIAGSHLSQREAGGALIVDAALESLWDIEFDYRNLLNYFTGLATESLAHDAHFFDECFWPSIERSRSSVLRAFVLDLLTRHEPGSRSVLLDKLLCDGRLYFLAYTHRYIQRGIRMRWSSLAQQERRIVIANIRNCGREPAGSIYWPGPLLAAIPEDDQPRELRVFVDLHHARGWRLELDVPTSTTPYRPPAVPEPGWIPVQGVSDGHQRPWQDLARWERGRIGQATALEWSALVATVEDLVNGPLPTPDALLDRTNSVERLVEFSVRHAEKRDADLQTTTLKAKTLEALVHWSIDSLRMFSPLDVVADHRGLDGSDVSLPKRAELWMNFASLADSVLWEKDFKDDDVLSKALFSAIDDVAQDPPARLAWHLFGRIRGWFRSGSQGRMVLWSLLAERVRSSEALSHGLRWLESFDRVEQQQLIRKWLASELSPPISPQRVFARNSGQHLGWAAMVRYESGQPSGSHDIIRELVAATSPAGLLSDAATHSLFVGQCVFGAKVALLDLKQALKKHNRRDFT